MRIYFLPSYPERAPSTRMRVYKMAEALRQLGQECFIIENKWSTKAKHSILQDIRPRDILYVQKWRNEFHCAEHIGVYKGRCKIVFDMDDHTEDPQALEMLALADNLVVGNHYLKDLYNQQHSAILTPTPVDIREYPEWEGEDGVQIAIAKCGIRSMIRRLEEMRPIFKDVRECKRYRLIIGGFEDSGEVKKVRAALDFVKSKCIRLKPYVEYLREVVPILQKAQVGILPFIKRDQGKSGHSALANLAMGIPTITTPFAECDYIIQDGVNGFLIDGDPLHSGQWQEKIIRLFESPKLRQQFREEGWKTIQERYDVPVIAANLLEDLKRI